MTENNKLANAKIYRIVSNVTGENYYGSTCEPTLARRLAKHRGHYKEYLRGTMNYITSFKILETGNYEIVLVEKLENCKSKDEMHQRERYYIENNECVNKVIVGRTHKEYKKLYYVNNKDKIQDYLIKNKEKIKEKKKIYDKIYREAKKHQQYLKEQQDNQRRISKDDFNFIFECDSKMLLPKTYIDIIPV